MQFLLGCDASKDAEGAIHWVNTNIVNVAVTRAKYRVYIIGDYEAWKKSDCISKAKEIIVFERGWSYMSRVIQDVPEKVQKSVLYGTVVVNSILLLCHISFGILFYLYKAPVLFYYNC